MNQSSFLVQFHLFGHKNKTHSIIIPILKRLELEIEPYFEFVDNTSFLIESIKAIQSSQRT
jgi:hypothetical protein